MAKIVKAKKLSKMNVNLRITMLFVSLFFIAIIIKLTYVSLSTEVDGTDLAAFVSSRNTKKETLYATRGTIYDVNGEKLGENSNSYTVIAYLSESRTTNPENPRHVVDKGKTAKALSEVLGISEESILSLLNQTLYQTYLGTGGKDIGEDVKRQIEKLNLPGIGFEESQKRTYKNKNYASYILGYARKNDSGEITGYLGIEGYYDDILKGTDGYKMYQQDSYGYQIPNTESYTVEAESGSDIYLSIDNRIQLILENTMSQLSEKYEMDWGIFVVMNAKTGAIVGSATNPTFNPNTLEGIESYMNPLVSYQYEPGSTMKVFSYLAAMENGLYNGEDTFQSGSIKLSDGTTIKDWNNDGWGKITYNKGFAHSSNVGATKLALSLGSQKLREYYESCGFGSKTGITLPAEASGTLNFKYESELANASFGQGMSVTPIQMLQALSAFANDGYMVKPYIVDKIVDAKGNTTFNAETNTLNKIASTENINKMKELMYSVVYDIPDNNSYAPSNMTIAGKTGTAEIATSGGYETGENAYIRSFGGFFPYEDPEYVFYFATKKINSKTSAVKNAVSMALGEIAKEINLVESGSDVDQEKIITIDHFTSAKTENVVATLTNKGLDVVVLGSGNYVVNQYPEAGITILKGNKVFLLTNKTDFTMPNVTGWSSSEIAQFCNLIGVKYVFNLYGTVISTNVNIGEQIPLDQTLEINLSP